jgi:hypothetical protein
MQAASTTVTVSEAMRLDASAVPACDLGATA